MTTCPSFTESVKCTADGDHTIAWGWTTSTGQWGSFPYTPPTGWKFDPRYSDERGPTGSHGGCRTCIMTLVHLITTQGDLVPTPTPTPDTHPTSGTVIDRITRVGDVGEPGYSAYGEELESCTYSGSPDDWHGATQGSLSGLLPTCYITESVYTFLTDDEIESCRSKIRGIVPNSYVKTWTYTDCTFRCRTVYCRGFKDGLISRPLPLPDPCAGVTCEDVCIGADKYSQVCAKEGADAGKCVFGEIIEANYFGCPGYVPPDPCEGIVCEPDCFGTSNKYETVCDEGICVIGAMIEENSVECGYVPPDDDIDDEPDDGIPPVDDEYPPKSELATDLSSIFGDIKPVHIIIAVLAMIFLGLLS